VLFAAYRKTGITRSQTRRYRAHQNDETIRRALPTWVAAADLATAWWRCRLTSQSSRGLRSSMVEGDHQLPRLGDGHRVDAVRADAGHQEFARGESGDAARRGAVVGEFDRGSGRDRSCVVRRHEGAELGVCRRAGRAFRASRARRSGRACGPRCARSPFGPAGPVLPVAPISPLGPA
jgi:hypothetical protein